MHQHAYLENEHRLIASWYLSNSFAINGIYVLGGTKELLLLSFAKFPHNLIGIR